MKSEIWSNFDQQAAETLILLKGCRDVNAVHLTSSLPSLAPMVMRPQRMCSRASSPQHDMAAPVAEELSSSVSFDSSEVVADQDGMSKPSNTTTGRRASRLRTRNSQEPLQQAPKPARATTPAASSPDSMLTNLPLLSAIFAHQAVGSGNTITRSHSSSFPSSPVHPSSSDAADHRPFARRCAEATASGVSAASTDSRSHHACTKRASSPAASHLSDMNPRPSKLPRTSILSAIASAATDTHPPTRPSTSSSPSNSTQGLKASALKRQLPVPSKSHMSTSTLHRVGGPASMDVTSSKPSQLWMLLEEKSGPVARCRPTSSNRSLLQHLPIMQRLAAAGPSVHAYAGFPQGRLQATAISIGDGTPA